MLTFLRRIRKSLMESGRASQYILYAVGEIVLVVIGILIALEINNWNESVKSHEIEQQLLVGLSTEILKNKSKLEEILLIHQRYVQTNLAILSLFNGDLQSVDVRSVDSLISNLRFGWTYNPRYGLLKSIISSGEIQHIRNKQLVSLLSEFEDNVADVTEESVETREIWRKSLSQLVAKYVPYNSEFRAGPGYSSNLPISHFPHNYQGFFRDRDLESLLAIMTAYVNITIEEERELLATLDKMISLIEVEIP